MEYKKGAQVGGESQGLGSAQQQQPVAGIANSSSGTVSLSTVPSFPAGQGFYTSESLQCNPSSSSQTLLQSSRQDVCPPGTSYGEYGLAPQQQQPVMTSEEIKPSGAYALMHQQQQQGMPTDLTATSMSYVSIMQHQGMPYGLILQGNPGEQSISVYSDHGSYRLGQQRQETPGSVLPLHYPIDHRVEHFPAQQVYAYDDLHSQFPARCPINPSFPDPLQSGGAIEGLQDGQWLVQKEPIREYVGQPLSYRGFGAPSGPENLSQVWRPAFDESMRKMLSQFKGKSRVSTYKKYRTLNTSKKNGPAGNVEGAGWCSVCQIDCITMEVLEQHKGGKKHNKHLQRQMQQFANPEKGSEFQENNLNVVKTSSPMPFPNGLGETQRNQNELAMKSQVAQQQQPDEKQIVGGKEQSAVCESNIGKREQKVKGSADDIAYKRQKLLDVGTSIESVKVCSLCNVVCNSQTVFDFHLSGKKHVARLKNLYEVVNPAFFAKNDAKKAAAGVNAGMSTD